MIVSVRFLDFCLYYGLHSFIRCPSRVHLNVSHVLFAGRPMQLFAITNLVFFFCSECCLTCT